MAISYLTSNGLDNRDNEISHCINQPKALKKGSNIDQIYKQIIKINDFKEIYKDYLLAGFCRFWQLCRMNKRLRSSSLITPLFIQ